MKESSNNEEIFLLYDGESDDGRGHGKYIGRTYDKVVAEKHYKKCRANPYSTGKVDIVTDNKITRMHKVSE